MPQKTVYVYHIYTCTSASRHPHCVGAGVARSPALTPKLYELLNDVMSIMIILYCPVA